MVKLKDVLILKKFACLSGYFFSKLLKFREFIIMLRIQYFFLYKLYQINYFYFIGTID